MNIMSYLHNSSTIFWDFDGVIKESVDVKTQAYCDVFKSFGDDPLSKIKKHHEANGGVSRYEKIPQYLRICGVKPTANLITEYCRRFAEVVVDGVVDSAFVPGFERLFDDLDQCNHVIVTATPQEEIHLILKKLGLLSRFSDIYGAPCSKTDAIHDFLSRKKEAKKNCVMIGDSFTDKQAAKDAGICFILRLHNANAILVDDECVAVVRDFNING